MRKKMIAMLFVLILTLSGCADVSTVPEESDNTLYSWKGGYL